MFFLITQCTFISVYECMIVVRIGSVNLIVLLQIGLTWPEKVCSLALRMLRNINESSCQLTLHPLMRWWVPQILLHYTATTSSEYSELHFVLTSILIKIRAGLNEISQNKQIQINDWQSYSMFSLTNLSSPNIHDSFRRAKLLKLINHHKFQFPSLGSEMYH